MASNKQQDKTAAPTEKVKLLKPHTHEDVPYEAGEELTLNTADAEWLKAQKIAEAVTA
ncbi:MAG: hypothetical protein QM702_07475 [Rubrivivax sp.]